MNYTSVYIARPVVLNLFGLQHAKQKVAGAQLLAKKLLFNFTNILRQ